MKNHFKKVIAGLMALALVAVSTVTMPALQAHAATKEVTIYYQNTLNMKSVYCYTWYGAGAVGTAWPGQKMTDAGNGWLKANYTGDKPLNVIFNDNGKPKTVQTANHTPKDLPLTQDAYWFTNATSTSQNAGGMGGGTNVTVNTTAKSGWPTPTAAKTGTASKSTTAAAATTTTKDATPKTGDNNAVAGVSTLGVVSLAAVCLLFGKKKMKA